MGKLHTEYLSNALREETWKDATSFQPNHTIIGTFTGKKDNSKSILFLYMNDNIVWLCVWCLLYEWYYSLIVCGMFDIYVIFIKAEYCCNTTLHEVSVEHLCLKWCIIDFKKCSGAQTIYIMKFWSKEKKNWKSLHLIASSHIGVTTLYDTFWWMQKRSVDVE